MIEMRWWRPKAHSFFSKILDLRMLEEVGPAVQYVLVNDAAAWGAVTEGAEAWALLRVTGELERIIGLVSSGVLGAMTKAVDGLPEEKRFGLKIYATKEEGDTARAADPVEQAWMWPWDRDEGETLCRASMLVFEAARRIAPGWKGLGEWLAKLAEYAGPKAWKCGKEPSVALEILVSAAAAAWRRRSEESAAHAKRALVIPGVPWAVAGAFGAAGDERSVWNKGKLRIKNDGGIGIGKKVPVVVAPEEWTGHHKASGLGGVLAAWAIGECHRRWQMNPLTADHVFLPVGINERRKAGIAAERKDVEAGLQWLCETWVAGRPLLYGYDVVRLHGGGRPAEFYSIEMGPPLAPWRGIEAHEEAGLEMPSWLRWVTPVLPVEWSPAVLRDPRTMNRVRLAYSFGLGMIFTKHRVEYLRHGGIGTELLLNELEVFGLYRRSQADLCRKFADECQVKPKEQTLPGFGPPGPTLVSKTKDGVERIGFGPAFDSWAAVVIGAGQFSEIKSRAALALHKAKKGEGV